MQKIAFIGLGNMGCPMASNLVKNNQDVCGFDLSKEAMSLFEKAGGKLAETASEACRDAEVLIIMLPSGKHVADLLSSKFIAKLKPGTLIIESSTIDPATAKEVASLADSHGCHMIDAPVSGGTVGAQNATLTFMVGGTEEALEMALPHLSLMGKNIFHAGPSGAGQMTKICNNLLLSILMTGTSEALNLGIANGLDPKVLSEIMQKSSGRNWALEVYNPCPGVMEESPASRDYAGGFAVDLMKKDLGLAAEAAHASNAQIPLGSKAFHFYNVWSDAGNGRLDFSSIFRFISNKKEQSK